MIGICAFMLLLGAGQLARTQIKQEKSSPGQETSTPNIVALHPNDSEVFDWDGGKVKFIASSEETGGRWTVMEVTERPGYKTPVHRHNFTDEQFYVMEGGIDDQRRRQDFRIRCWFLRFDPARDTARAWESWQGSFQASVDDDTGRI